MRPARRIQPDSSTESIVNSRPHVDIARILLVILILSLLILSSLYILKPFLPALIAEVRKLKA